MTRTIQLQWSQRGIDLPEESVPSFQNKSPFVAALPDGSTAHSHRNHHHHFLLSLDGKSPKVVRSSPFQKLALRKGLSSASKAASTPSLLPPAPEETDVLGTTSLPGHRRGSSAMYEPQAFHSLPAQRVDGWQW